LFDACHDQPARSDPGMNAAAARLEAPDTPSPALLASVLESELDFYQRRALEEAQAAQRARCPQAAASHRYLAAAYAERVRRDLEVQARFDQLLGSLTDGDGEQVPADQV
jgi:hypothetical protein